MTEPKCFILRFKLLKIEKFGEIYFDVILEGAEIGPSLRWVKYGIFVNKLSKFIQKMEIFSPQF